MSYWSKQAVLGILIFLLANYQTLHAGIEQEKQTRKVDPAVLEGLIAALRDPYDDSKVLEEYLLVSQRRGGFELRVPPKLI